MCGMTAACLFVDANKQDASRTCCCFVVCVDVRCLVGMDGWMDGCIRARIDDITDDGQAREYYAVEDLWVKNGCEQVRCRFTFPLGRLVGWLVGWSVGWFGGAVTR